MTTPTITIPITETPAELATLWPHVHCTPLLGAAAVLPTKTARTSGRLHWHWKTITRETTIDGYRIRIGDRAMTFPSGSAYVVKPGDTLELTAALQSLHQIT